ncbi:MAG: 4Fe-4S dicluster domain-containing protein, partial [Polyangiaceae bacterium]|nr:4Fe-4S dicluster domain-containing protein [Polyangiaceae bacterium]
MSWKSLSPKANAPTVVQPLPNKKAKGIMGRHLNVIQELLHHQQDLSAVEQFSQLHDEGFSDSEAQDGIYESLIPLTKPGPGQQYGFAVDLDACTGCKACVVGCNKLNGLDEDEAWRSVGLIHGGSAELPLQQTVTTACHHCLDPACMNGCPVGAYEKSEETGIVKHLDDQCIGCQYCTLTCPYEVPQYNRRLGIVRKCDMCADRLAEGEEPACVQSCPNGAISIKLVDAEEVLAEAQGDAFLPGAPSPGITAPTTAYATERNLPRNVLP